VTCEIRNILGFHGLLGANIQPLDLIGLAIDRMKRQLNTEAAAFKHVKVRPWFIDEEIEPQGLMIIMTGEV
jgi:hypothetical protein